MAVFPYAGPNRPHTNDILNAVSNIITTQIAPIQWMGSPILKTVLVGGIKDYTQAVPVAVVSLKTAPTRRKDFGGQVDNEPHILVTIFVSYVDKQAAEAQIAELYDLCTLYFQEHSVLSDSVTGVYDARPVEDSPLFGYITAGVPLPLRLVEFELQVTQRYALPYGVKR